MIKIQINDIDTFKRDYLLKIKNDIVRRVANLRNSARHLADPTNINDDEIVDAKHITKNILDLIRKKKIDKKELNKAVYKQTLQNYRVGATVETVNWDSLLEFLDYLLDDSNSCLDELLVGAPDSLSTKNTELLNQFNINAEIYIEILKNAFSYVSLRDEIRQFFHEKEIVICCPYCNLSSALYSINDETGKVADQHHLDHFFDKATYPLLSVSVFNLVPCDYVCNSANKHEIHFSDEFHLNPYISGFKNDVKFVPVMEAFGEDIISFTIEIKARRDSERWRQLVGDEDYIDVAPENGNVNVFQLRTRYSNSSVVFPVKKILKKFRNLAVNEKSLRDILDKVEVNPEDNYENFKSWYEDEARTKFHQKDFGAVIYSKLYRDLLDYVFAVYPENFHERVNEILTDSYLPINGGE